MGHIKKNAILQGMRIKHIFKLILIVFIILTIFNFITINSEAANDKISSKVRSQILKSERVSVIIILKDQLPVTDFPKKEVIPSLKKHTSTSQRGIVSLLKEEKIKGRADKINQFWIVNAIAVNASSELIEILAKRNDIASIELDSEFHLIEDFSTQVSSGQIANATSEIKRINAPDIWELGIDGTGVNVSVIDSGINASHPDIAGRVVKWVDYVSSYPFPYDDDGHGTHTAGTIGGNGIGGITTGVAPNVSLLIAKVCNYHGFCSVSDIVSGIQWSVESDSDVISISIGGPRDSTLTIAVNNAIDMGVVVIAAAGNSGPAARTIEFPAGEKNVIAAGAVDSSDNIATFSSRGPVTIDGETIVKPDVSGPGIGITSLNSLTSGYIQYSGTSMAAPHVSGTAALLLQAAKMKGIILTPADVKNILENTSVDLGAPGKDNNYGAGRIDVFEAVKNYVSPTINGTVKDGFPGTGIASVTITTNTSVSTVTNETGFYSLVLPDGTYSLTATRDPEYYPNSSVIVTVTAYSTVTTDITLYLKPTGTITGKVTDS